MSLFSTLRTGVSGMNAQSNRISTVAENIQNASTTGYKRTSAEFSSLLLSSGDVGNYNSGAVETTLRRAVSEGGPIASTNSDKDLAIQGNGFFVVRDTAGTPFMTRSGNFVVDGKSGNLVNAGGFSLQGYKLADGGMKDTELNGTAGLVPVNLSVADMKASPTTKGTISGNLPIDSPPLTPIGTGGVTLFGYLANDIPKFAPDSAVPAGPNYSQMFHIDATDSDGSSIPLDIYITVTDKNDLNYSIYRSDAASSFPSKPVFSQTIERLGAARPWDALIETIPISDTKKIGIFANFRYNSEAPEPNQLKNLIPRIDVSNFPARGADDYTFKTSFNAYGSVGQLMNVDVYINKREDGQWDAMFYEAGGTRLYPGPADAKTTFRFGNSGELIDGKMVEFSLSDGTPLKVDLSNVRQLAGAFGLTGNFDGSGPSPAAAVAFDPDGTVYAVHSDGTRKAAFKVPLADVASPNNLTPRAGNVFTTSAESGDIQIGFAGQGGRGTLKAGALEQSNVDVSTELTTMIESQTVYTANSKVFMTGNELLETLMNLKR